MIKNLTLFTLLMCFAQLTAQDNKAFPLKFAFRHSDTMRAALPAGSINNINATVYNVFRNELWMSSSHNDSLMRFSVPGGRYLGAVRATGLIAPLTNTTRFFRGLTQKDRYFIWGVNNTDTVRKIDPTTAQEVARFIIPKWMGNQSYITFDSTKGGAFWISGSSNIIRRVDSTFRTVTDSITIDGTFNSGGYTGIAFDALSPGGPYIWILGARHPETIQFGIQNSFVTAIQVSVATKKRTGVQKTIVDDFTFLLNTNQSGRGFTIAQIPGLPKPVIIISTGKFTSGSSSLLPADLSGVTAGYELSSTINPDASLDSLAVTPNYSMLPQQFVRPLSVKAIIRNAISNATTAGNIRLVTRGPAGDTLNNQTTPFSVNASTAAFIPVTTTNISGFKKGVNTIRGTAIVSNDPVLKNDTISAFFAISDSTIARDYCDFYNMRTLESFIYGGSSSLTHTLGTGVTSLIPERPEIGQAYQLDWPITITSATAICKPGVSGDTTRFKVYTFDANGKPLYAGQSGLYQITPQDSANQKISLPLIAPVRINAGQRFMMTMTEGFNAPAVWGTPMGYEIGSTYVHLLRTLGGWVRIDTTSNNFLATRFNRALAIRPNIQLRTNIGETTNVGKLTLAPNPTSGVINLDVEMNVAEDLIVRVTNISGQTVLTQKFDAAKAINQSLDLSQHANGIYILSLTTAKGTLTRKIVKE